MNAPQIRDAVHPAMTDSIERLFEAVVAAKNADPATSRTARLLRAGRAKMAKKLAEEAMEVIIADLHGGCDAVVQESADLLYHLAVLWAARGVHPSDVWNEMDRRERMLGLAEKLPKPLGEPMAPSAGVAETAAQHVVAFPGRPARKRR
jgi:phosphoribosyl-ATP pyrophosphohydrolase